MARYVLLNSSFIRAGAGVVLAISLLGSLRAEPVAPAKKTDVPATNNAAATLPEAMKTAAGQPTAKVAPAKPQDAFTRYGRILTPSDEVAYPLKLNLPFPGIGEMKIPSQEELNVRDKLEQLARLSDDDIRAQLEQWPPYSKMKLGDEGQMLMRIQQFKDQRSKIAEKKAHDLGLLTMTPEQKAKFEKDYWDKRLKMEHDLVRQFEPVMKAQEQKMQEDLFRSFSAPNPAGKPPAPAPKTPPPASAPAANATPAPMTNVAPVK